MQVSVGEEHTNQMKTKCKIWGRKEWKDVDSKQNVMIELGGGDMGRPCRSLLGL